MKPDTIVKLGDFEFSQFEVPERIPFGGDQQLVVHKLVGGARVVDSMGRDDAPLEWSGWFIGDAALLRALYVDGLRIAGKPLKLTWYGFDFTVVIKSFSADFERFYKLPYRISCTVVKDNANPITTIIANSVDAAVRADMTAAAALGDTIADGPLSTALGTLDTAIKAVSEFATAVQSTIDSVLIPLAAVQARVKILTASVGNVITNVTTLGGVLPNNPIAQQAAKLMQQVTSMTQAPALYNLQSVLGRIDANLGTIGGGTSTISTGGGNLFALAQKAYGDATKWPALANANSLTDPQIQGLVNIAVPANAANSDGVLTA